MTTIDERIKTHEDQKRKLHDKKNKLENQLSDVNRKIVFHWAAIMNLERKKRESGVVNE